MSEELIIFPNELPIESYQSLYQKVCNQIAKDFYPYVEMSDLPEILEASWIKSELQRMLTILVRDQAGALGAVIYRVDLTEKNMRKTMNSSSTNEKLDELAAMILRREAQKVWLRHTLK
jgi:hypothetical protein